MFPCVPRVSGDQMRWPAQSRGGVGAAVLQQSAPSPIWQGISAAIAGGQRSTAGKVTGRRGGGVTSVSDPVYMSK